jgi:hypothetical protein
MIIAVEINTVNDADGNRRAGWEFWRVLADGRSVRIDFLPMTPNGRIPDTHKPDAVIGPTQVPVPFYARLKALGAARRVLDQVHDAPYAALPERQAVRDAVAWGWVTESRGGWHATGYGVAVVLGEEF